MAAAGGAGGRLGAGPGASAVAGVAFFHGGDADLGFRAPCCVFQRDFQVVAQVRAAIDIGAPAAPSAAATEDVAEDVAESIGKAAHACAASAHACLRIHSGMAVLVVGATLAAVRENLVGFLGFLEMFFRLGIVRIAVRMVLHRQLAVGFLDFIIRGVAVDA